MPIRRPSQRERDARVLEATLGPLPLTRKPPVLVILTGLPGSGKSHIASEICRRYPLARLESDALRKALFKRPTYSQQRAAAFSPQFTPSSIVCLHEASRPFLTRRT